MVADEIEISTAPRVKVIQNGREVDTSAIDNYDQFMSFLMQASIAANQAKVRQYCDDKRSHGRAPSIPLSITSISQEIECPEAAQSLYVFNNGPGQIFVAVNVETDPPIPIIPGVAAYLPFETHVIERFYVWSATGTTATATAIFKS
jgi:hypothetical protein